MQGRSRGALSVTAATLLMGACGSVPTVPGGPLQRAGTVQLSMTPIVDVSVVTSTVMTGDPTTVGPVGTSRATNLSIDAGSMLPVPARAGGRVALTDWADVEVDWGWSGIGGELRAGAPEGTRLPFAVSLGARSGSLIPIALDERIRNQHEVRARVEVYPRLSPPAGQMASRFNGVLALGISDGLHYHQLTLQKGQDHFEFLRDETRIEGALGFEYRTRRTAISLTALPYVVPRGSFPSKVSCGIGHCYEFDQRALLTYRQDFGLSLALNIAAWIF